MESPEAGSERGGQRDQRLPLGSKDRAVVKGSSEISNTSTHIQRPSNASRSE